MFKRNISKELLETEGENLEADKSPSSLPRLFKGPSTQSIKQVNTSERNQSFKVLDPSIKEFSGTGQSAQEDNKKRTVRRISISNFEGRPNQNNQKSQFAMNSKNSSHATAQKKEKEGQIIQQPTQNQVKKFLSIDLLYYPKMNTVLTMSKDEEKKSLRYIEKEGQNNSKLREKSRKRFVPNGHQSLKNLKEQRSPIKHHHHIAQHFKEDRKKYSNNEDDEGMEETRVRVESGFLRYETIHRSQEYKSIKNKLDESRDKSSIMEIYQRELDFNRRSIDNYKNKIKQTSKHALNAIVKEVDYARRKGEEKMVVFKRDFGILKDNKHMNDSEEDGEMRSMNQRESNDESLQKSIHVRELRFMWMPRREVRNSILEYREGRAICGNGKGKAFIYGGFANGGDIENDMLCYDINSNMIEQIYNPTQIFDHVPLPRAYHTMTYFNESVYIFGGELIKKSSNLPSYYFDEIWRFSLTSDTYSPVKTKNRIEGRIRHASCTFGNGYMVVSGGLSQSDTILNDMHVISLSGNPCVSRRQRRLD